MLPGHTMRAVRMVWVWDNPLPETFSGESLVVPHRDIIPFLCIGCTIVVYRLL